MKEERRNFLKLILLGGVLLLFRTQVKTQNTPYTSLKKAMFWKKSN